MELKRGVKPSASAALPDASGVLVGAREGHAPSAGTTVTAEAVGFYPYPFPANLSEALAASIRGHLEAYGVTQVDVRITQSDDETTVEVRHDPA